MRHHLGHGVRRPTHRHSINHGDLEASYEPNENGTLHK